MLPEIVTAFQNAVDDWLTGIKELAQQFSPDADEHTAFMQSEYLHSRGLMAVDGAMYFPNNTSSDWGKAIFVEYDFYVNDGSAVITNPVYVAKAYNNGNYASDEEAEAEFESFLEALPTFHTTSGTISGLIYTDEITLRAYDGGVYNPNNVYMTYGNMSKAGRERNYPGGKMIYSGVSYTVNSNNIISTTGATEFQLNPDSQWYGLLWSLSSYPWVGNAKDITYINNFVNKMISTGQSTNNYTGTYTTPDNKTIRIYYGDNYTFTYVENDDPVSYDDIKNAINIAINQINDDNDTDIHTEPWSPEPPEPPEPVTDDDYIDMGLGVETDGMAMYNMAVVTRDELIQLITDFEANADTGLSFIPHVLGLYKLGFESSLLLTTKSEQIKLHKEPNGTSAFTSVENYKIVENQEIVIDCGSITVDREELLTNTFLDFSPYTTYEMFIPGCGWITLPDTIVGRTISVAIVFDLTTCSCKGVVRSEGNLIGGSGTTLATVNGIIGSSVPLSINETGLQRAAIMNGSTQAAMALGTAFMGVGIGNPYMGASGIAMAASALASTHIAGNSTYTSTKGGATDYSVFGDGWKAVLKITRPVLEIPDNYGHSVGFVVNRYAQLSEFSGFTVCINPHIHITATSAEKEEIKMLLEQGVILPIGEE